MSQPVFYCAGTTKACSYASAFLEEQGIPFANAPDGEVTDLLLDVPSLQKAGILRSGEDFHSLLTALPKDITIWGGMLNSIGDQYPKVDLLSIPDYVTKNAAITADCAVRLCALSLHRTWQDCRILVIGWGRIGKHLCRLLRSLGAQVTVCARSAPDRALLSAFGYHTIAPDNLSGNGYQIIFNTAPSPMMDEEAIGDCPIPVDLASEPGLIGRNVLTAKGLPGIYAPYSSGRLIAETILSQFRR